MSGHEGVRASRPVFLYDGDCGFCTRSVRFLHRHLPVRAEVQPWQAADLAALGVTAQACQRAVQWVAPSGVVDAGAAAFGRLLLDCGGGWRLPGRVILTPPVSWLAAAAYRLVARYRYRLPGSTASCQLPPRR
ncbi:MAG TPA: DUF393 domain-containing protein [Mycobacteriales bacterium]|nr:DUF393 domain-containing protein [Mycobacteriales bacterium]